MTDLDLDDRYTRPGAVALIDLENVIPEAIARVRDESTPQEKWAVLDALQAAFNDAQKLVKAERDDLIGQMVRDLGVAETARRLGLAQSTIRERVPSGKLIPHRTKVGRDRQAARLYERGASLEFICRSLRMGHRRAVRAVTEAGLTIRDPRGPTYQEVSADG